jgi:hypothetical protein
MINLEQFGYSRAVWVAAPGQWWLRPGGLAVCTEEEALREVAELVVDVLAADGMAAGRPSPSRMSARNCRWAFKSLRGELVEIADFEAED